MFHVNLQGCIEIQVRLFFAQILNESEERVSEWYTIFTLAFQVILGFAVPRSPILENFGPFWVCLSHVTFKDTKGIVLVWFSEGKLISGKSRLMKHSF